MPVGETISKTLEYFQSIRRRSCQNALIMVKDKGGRIMDFWKTKDIEEKIFRGEKCVTDVQKLNQRNLVWHIEVLGKNLEKLRGQ